MRESSFIAANHPPELENGTLIMALPKGRILDALGPLMRKANLHPDVSRIGDETRCLKVASSDPKIEIVRVRAFDVATFVAYGGAQIGICGADVLMEFDYPELYAPLDLNLGGCRISVACTKDRAQFVSQISQSHLRIATKYPSITRRHFASRGINAEIVHLNGAMELAPDLGMADAIVDLVDTGSTLKAHGLQEIDVIAHISSRLVINRIALKTRPHIIKNLLKRLKTALDEI